MKFAFRSHIIYHFKNNIMIAGFTKYHKKNSYQSSSNAATFTASTLVAVKGPWDFEGKGVHAHMVKTGSEENVYSGTKLIAMYSKNGNLRDARQVFDKMPERNEVSWTAMVTGYIRHGCHEEGIKLYCRMQQEGIELDTFVFPSALKACAGLSALRRGEEIHGHVITSGFETDVCTASALVDMYAKCGRLDCAWRVFDAMAERSVVSWNAILAGYSQNGQSDEALELFWQMQQERVKPSLVTIVVVLPACATVGGLQLGREIHSYFLRNGGRSDVCIETALVDMYVKCGSIEVARRVFEKMPERNVVSWNAMVVGYAQNGHVKEALGLFYQMQLAGVKPDLITWTAIIAGYAHNGNSDEALKFFHQMRLSGIEPNVISWTAIITGYGQSGHCDKALEHFREMELVGIRPDVISWNAMIAAYAQNSHWDEAVGFFRRMQITGLTPNAVTIATALTACANLAAMQQGKEIHNYTIRMGIYKNSFVGSSLLDMYAKCGNIESARQVFDDISHRNLVLWNSMIAGYAMHGHGDLSLRLFHQMQQEGIKPDHITFTGVLSACSHAGLVEEGWQYFEFMTREYEIAPTKEHYTCMVDLLGRAGCLAEAHDFVSKMPFEPDVCVWGALLGACRVHCNVEIAELAAEHLLKLDPENTGTYVLLSNIHAVAGKWDNVARVRKMMKSRGLRKIPGCSWIEVKNRMHGFLVGDMSHPQTEEIYAMLQSLTVQLKAAGYVPDTTFVLYEMEQYKNKQSLE